MELSVMLIAVLLILVVAGTIGYCCGLVRSILILVSLVFGVVTFALIAVGVRSLREKDTSEIALTIVFIVILGVLAKLIRWIFKALDSVAELPVLSFLNKITGAVIGLACGIIVIWACILLIEKTGNRALINIIQNGTEKDNVMKYLYDANLVRKLFLTS